MRRLPVRSGSPRAIRPASPWTPWGDGRLVALEQPPREKCPRGTTMITLTTCGLDETCLANLQSRWQGWWNERFEAVAPGCG